MRVSFTRKIFNLDLRYYDTNLSKEDCFVLTGDPNAIARRRYRPADKSRQNNALITVWLEVRVLPGPPRTPIRTKRSGDSAISPPIGEEVSCTD